MGGGGSVSASASASAVSYDGSFFDTAGPAAAGKNKEAQRQQSQEAVGLGVVDVDPLHPHDEKAKSLWRKLRLATSLSGILRRQRPHQRLSDSGEWDGRADKRTMAKVAGETA